MIIVYYYRNRRRDKKVVPPIGCGKERSKSAMKVDHDELWNVELGNNDVSKCRSPSPFDFSLGYLYF